MIDTNIVSMTCIWWRRYRYCWNDNPKWSINGIYYQFWCQNLQSLPILRFQTMISVCQLAKLSLISCISLLPLISYNPLAITTEHHVQRPIWHSERCKQYLLAYHCTSVMLMQCRDILATHVCPLIIASERHQFRASWWGMLWGVVLLDSFHRDLTKFYAGCQLPKWHYFFMLVLDMQWKNKTLFMGAKEFNCS